MHTGINFVFLSTAQGGFEQFIKAAGGSKLRLATNRDFFGRLVGQRDVILCHFWLKKCKNSHLPGSNFFDFDTSN